MALRKSSGISARAWFYSTSFHAPAPAPSLICVHCGSGEGFDVRPVVIDAAGTTLALCVTDRMSHRIGAVLEAAKAS